ncbi:MAG: Lrp/AsnC ligand binding domain-containing protein, partial [Candidatus Thermoplasmatota archaeon]|nr:Lrp/AsnC ligand binding domain-containing protein [Candidatus Thermoplasmatota archaeon]
PVTLIFSLIFSVKKGEKTIGQRYIDPSFRKFRLIRKEEVKYQLLAGLGNAMYTIGYFALFVIIKDPSVVLPLAQIVILYLVLIESVNEKDVPTLPELQSIIIVTFGAILGSISLTGNLTLESILIVFFVINPGWVLLTVYQRKLKWLKIDGNYNDSINIRFWNVLISFLMTAVMIFFYDIFANESHLTEGLVATFNHIGWITLISIGAFFAFIFYIRALGIGKASVVQAVRSSTIIFTIPVSIFIAYLGIIPQFPLDPTMLLIKLIGIVMMVLGIASFALTLVKAYMFIKIKPGYDIEETMQKLWKIHGVTRVAAVAGPYDFMVKIRTRTLVRGYERIIRKMEEIDAIEEYKWQSVLKEWEEI